MCHLVVISTNGLRPRHQTTGAAGLDLCASVEQPVVVESRGAVTVDTGIRVRYNNEKYIGLIYGRSGLRRTNFVTVLNDSVPSSAHDNIKVRLRNEGEAPFTINFGDRIAQLVIEHRSDVGRQPVKTPTPIIASQDACIRPNEHSFLQSEVRTDFTADMRGAVYAGREAQKLDVFRGLIDSDYRGTVGCMVFNSSFLDNVVIHKGDIIGIVCYQYLYKYDTIELVSATNGRLIDYIPAVKNKNRVRGHAGFGSTDICI